MLPGKKYKPEDLLLILRRRLWLLLVPFAVVAAGTAAVARKLPDRYRSQALILVVPPRVPATYVMSNVTTRLEDRLQVFTQKVLSRTSLEGIIQEFNLYPDERRKGIMEDVVEQMRNVDIQVEPIKGADAFTVSFLGSNPRTVQKVADKLATLFIDESLRDRENLAEGTNQFLEAQLEDARRRLVDQEKKLQDYRMKFSGELPSQAQSNLQALQNTQMQLQATLESINRAREQKLLTDRLLADLQSPTAAPDATPIATGSTGGEAPGATASGTTAQRLEYAKAVRAALLQHYKETWPDVQRAERLIADLEKQLNAEALLRPVSADEAPVSVSPAELARQRRIRELKAQEDQIDRQIANAQAEEQRLRSVASGYQQRVDVVPAHESEMAELTRDYGTLTSLYTGLLAKKEESQIAANLERGEIGEQFKMLDPARLPEKPISPDRPRINIMGMVAGLAIGIAIIGLLEYRDTTFKTDDEITSLLALPVLAVVPLMQSDRDRRRAFTRRLILGCGLGSTVLGCLAVLIYTFVR